MAVLVYLVPFLALMAIQISSWIFWVFLYFPNLRFKGLEGPHDSWFFGDRFTSCLPFSLLPFLLKWNWHMVFSRKCGVLLFSLTPSDKDLNDRTFSFDFLYLCKLFAYSLGWEGFVWNNWSFFLIYFYLLLLLLLFF